MRQISPKVLLRTCCLPKYLESIDLGASQQCAILRFKLLKRIILSCPILQFFQNSYVKCILNKVFLFCCCQKYIFHDWCGFNQKKPSKIEGFRLKSIRMEKAPRCTFWGIWRIQIQIYPQTSIEPKDGAFYMTNKVSAHGLVLLVQLDEE